MFLIDRIRKSSFLLMAVLLSLATLSPLFTNTKAHAYGLVTQRFIKLSSSKAADTDVTYSVGFTVATTAAVAGMVVNVCSNSPVLGDSCTAPTGFAFHAKTGDNTLVLANQTGLGGNNFSKDLTGATDNLLVLSRTSASISSGQAITIDLGSSGGSDGVTNPNGGTIGVAPENNITFYARIMTFDTAAHAEAYTATGANTGNIDAGGIALSTANQLTITAKVQERLTFCVYTSGTACANGIGSSIALGDANGVLDNNVEYTNNSAKFGVSTNANGLSPSNSVSIRLRGGTLKTSPACADGSGQSCSINPVGNTATTTAAGTEYFGLRITVSGAPLTATAPYAGGSGTQFAFDDNNTTGTQSTYGQEVASTNASTEQTGTLIFVGDIAAATEPGIYTTTLTFVATGTY